jgi:hypothetical protein
MVWAKYSDLLSEKTFRDMKVLEFNHTYFLYAKAGTEHRLYRSGVPDIDNWENAVLTGFPNDAVLSQITVFEGGVYVNTEAGGLYYSTDGQVWSPANNKKPIRTILGYLPENAISGRKAVLCCITEEEGVSRFVTIDKAMEYTVGRDVPQLFPVSGFGQFHYKTMHFPRLVVASGRDLSRNLSNRAWATMDGLNWSSLSNPQATFSGREGAAVFYYNDSFFLVGGFGESGVALKDIWFSKDQGINWVCTKRVLVEVEEEDGEDEQDYYEDQLIYPMPEEYEARGFSSVIVDTNNYMLLFGGKAAKDANVLNEVWRGRINRLGFGKD